MTPRHVAVLGAGVVGTCIAYCLQRDGHTVTLIDQAEPGAGCSFGNAGLIQGASVVPIASPGTLWLVPRMLINPNLPLVLRWRHLPSLLPYLTRFVAESTPARFRQNSAALATIIPRAWEFWEPILREVGEIDNIGRSGELHVYCSKTSFDAARPSHAARRAANVEAREVFGADLHALEPSLATDIQHGVFLPEAYLVKDPFKLTQVIARAFVGCGGRIQRGVVTGIDAQEDRVTVALDSGALPADNAVIALGAFAGPLMRMLGCSMPLNSERGYHLMLKGSPVSPGRTLISGDWRFAISPMANGVCLAGTAEMTRIGAPPDAARATRLLPLAQRIVPGLASVEDETWMGHRPSLPDTCPAIGPLPKHPNVICAFGHGHSGLTLAGATGRMVADMIGGRPMTINPAPFDPGRFRRRGFRLT